MAAEARRWVTPPAPEGSTPPGRGGYLERHPHTYKSTFIQRGGRSIIQVEFDVAVPDVGGCIWNYLVLHLYPGFNISVGMAKRGDVRGKVQLSDYTHAGEAGWRITYQSAQCHGRVVSALYMGRQAFYTDTGRKSGRFAAHFIFHHNTKINESII